MRNSSIALAAMLLAIVPGAARAAEPACLTPQEFSSLAGYALPSLISGAAKRCGPSIGPTAYLSRSGHELVSRYAQSKPGLWPSAKAAFLKLSNGKDNDANKLIATLPDETLQQMLDSVMEGLASQQIPVEQCSTIDNAVRLLAPLPPQNTAELIALAAGLGAKTGKAKLGSFAMCPA